MKLENVKVGDKFSTITKLYKALGYESCKGNQKITLDKEISRYLHYEKTGKISRGKVTNEIVITEIFDAPKEKVDGRKNNGRAKTGKYSHIPTTKGVYYIVDNDKNIYIGSTNVSFVHRYQQHTQKDNHCESKVIISKEHTFGVLYDMSDIEDVELIRMIEDEYINYFSNNTEYNLVNKRGNKIKTIRQLKFKNKKPIKLTKKIIKLTNEEDYLKAIEILLENGISIENKLV